MRAFPSCETTRGAKNEVFADEWIKASNLSLLKVIGFCGFEQEMEMRAFPSCETPRGAKNEVFADEWIKASNLSLLKVMGFYRFE